MEIESEEEEDDEAGRGGDEVKFVKSGSFGSGFLKNKNIFSLRLTTTDSNATSKKSPVSPYSRQTSSSDSQKSAVSLQPTIDWETPPVAPTTNQNGSSLRPQRRSSISSCYSITENLCHNEVAAVNPSKSFRRFTNFRNFSQSTKLFSRSPRTHRPGMVRSFH